MTLPIIAITMGDATGVGPEIIMKSLAHRELFEQCRPVVIGDAGRLRKAGAVVGTSLEVQAITEIAEADFRHGSRRLPRHGADPR